MVRRVVEAVVLYERAALCRDRAAAAQATAKAAAAQLKKRQKRAKPSAAMRKALLADGEFGLLRFQVARVRWLFAWSPSRRPSCRIGLRRTSCEIPTGCSYAPARPSV